MRAKKIMMSAIAAGCVLGAFAAQRTDAEINTLVQQLLQKMTPEEKVAQLSQYSFGVLNDESRAQARGGLGSFLNVNDPAECNALQKEAVENSRLGIPLVFARDVIHGYKTIFPLPIGQAASWNTDLTRQAAAIAADEASSAGIRWTFSPMVDIARDSRWGRLAEGYGEDPLLATRMGVATVQGYQGNDLSKPNTMAACTKHFAGYGAVEGGRDYNTTWIPDNLLRDIYLPPFQACADAGSATFMCSFNALNGMPPSGNRYLLNDILRQEWGWDGLMVSDWGSINELIPHGVAADKKEAMLLAVNAGVDMDMEGHVYDNTLLAALKAGEVSEARVDSLVANVLRLKYRLGLFDNPYVDMNNARRYYAPASLEAARKAVEESAVLLKNEGAVLPIDFAKVKKVAVIGPMADAQHDQAGTWVFDLEKEHCITPLTALREKYGDKILYAPGLKFSRDHSHEGFAEALKAAKKADVVLMFAGEEAVLSGEAHCRADITLPGDQKELMAELKKAGKPIVLIVQAGRPIVLEENADMADAVLYLFHGGTMAGPGLANLLSGEANPSGHLPMSFPRMSGQNPIYYNALNTGRPATAWTPMDELELEAGQTSTGCESFYLDAGYAPAYPFGYGLSYTDFEISAPTLSATEIPADGQLSVTCTVTNKGQRAGKEVVQLYTRDLVGSLARPVAELKDFAKVELQPGQSQEITFILPASSLAFIGRDGKKAVEPGEFKLWVSDRSDKGMPVSFKIKN